MSPASDQQFNIWFPTIFGGLVVAFLWAIIKLFVSKFSLCIRREEGLPVRQPTDLPSRTAVQESKHQVQTALLSAMFSEVLRTLPRENSPMAEITDSNSGVTHSEPCVGSLYSSVLPQSGVTNHIDIETQEGITNMPVCTSPLNPITFTATVYFPDNTPVRIVRRFKLFFRKNARGRVKRLKSSIILQASLPIDPCILAKLGELAKDCMAVENRCTLQLGDWAIFYYNANEVYLGILAEGDVPVNVETTWQEGRTGITMCGLYLNGAQIKAATKRTSIALRSAGPPAQGPGHLDELYLPTEGLDIGESLIYAAKVVEADGFSLIVRSEASYIVPSRKKSSLLEVTWDRLQKISLSSKKIKSLPIPEDCHPEAAHRERLLQHLDTHTVLDVKCELNEKQQLLVEYWKGALQIEMLDRRKEVLYYLQQKLTNASVINPCTILLVNSRDRDYLEYWQRGLQDLNEVIQRSMHSPHSSSHFSIRGGIKFLLGDFEKALQDYDVANSLNTGGQPTALLERAIVKCMLAKYSEAMQDILTSVAINPNLNDIDKLQTYLQQILYQKQEFRSIQQPMLSNQHKTVQITPDFLTGDEWYPDPSKSVCVIATTGDTIAEDPPDHFSSVKSREKNTEEGEEDGEQNEELHLLWIKDEKVDTKIKEALEAWTTASELLSSRIDRKKEESYNHLQEIYHLVGFFSAFQGVLLTFVSQSSFLHGNNFWSAPLLASLAASFVTVVGVIQKFRRLKEMENDMSSEESALKVLKERVHIIKHKRSGKNLDVRYTTWKEEKRKTSWWLNANFLPMLIVLILFSILFAESIRQMCAIKEIAEVNTNSFQFDKELVKV